jgi:hypothetical protein
MERAGEILNELLKKILTEEKGNQGMMYYRFFSGWERIVGRKLFGHTKIADIKNHSLLVEVDHSGWMQILRLNERHILKKIKKYYPELEIHSIKIVVIGKGLSEGKEKTLHSLLHHSTQNSNEGDKMTYFNENDGLFGTIKDNKLRFLLKKLYESIEKKDNES